MSRRREEECDGVKVNALEESPVRPVPLNAKPKKSLSKIFNFQTVKIQSNEDNDSMGSTPKSEGGLQQEPEKTNEIDPRFIIIE